MTFYNPPVLALIIRKYVVSLLKIMADISKMDNRYTREIRVLS